MSAFSTNGKRACHHARNFKGWARPGLDVNFLPNANSHITALIIGAVPAALAPVVGSVDTLKA